MESLRNNAMIKMLIRLFLLACAALFLFLVFVCCRTLLAQAPFHGQSKMLTTQQLEELGDTSWVKVPWDGDDRPFAAARKTIDGELAAGVDPDSLVAQYSGAASANPTNAFDQFRWIYATRMQHMGPDTAPPDYSLEVLALAGAKDPHTYDFTRLRMLVSYLYGDKDAWQRLYDYNPGDTEVACHYAYSLSMSKTNADQDKAVKVINRVLRTGKEDPVIYIMAAFTYGNIGDNKADPTQYYQKAIDLDRQCIPLTSSTDWRRSDAVHCMTVLQKQLDKFKQRQQK
jgi:hypothetical protein